MNTHSNPSGTYKNLPALAGLGSFAQAMRPGLSVEECVTRLKRFHYLLKRLHQIFNNRLTAEPIYELKMGFSLHAHYCAEHVSALRKRVSEMREPPLGLDELPHPALEIFCDEILAAPSTQELLLGLYEEALPSLQAGLRKHMADTNLLADHPSIRVCRFALLEIEEMIAFGKGCLRGLLPETDRARHQGWVQRLRSCLRAAGGLDGSAASGSASAAASTPATPGEVPARRYSAEPIRYDPVPRRDERFADPYNMGVNAEVFLYDPSAPPEPKTLMMFYKRLREIDVPEMMASIIAETPGRPWD